MREERKKKEKKSKKERWGEMRTQMDRNRRIGEDLGLEGK
jgi:hypothetical protein